MDELLTPLPKPKVKPIKIVHVVEQPSRMRVLMGQLWKRRTNKGVREVLVVSEK